MIYGKRRNLPLADAIINDFCSIMPGTNISGKVELDNGVYIGTGAKIINYVRIGEPDILEADPVPVRSQGVNVHSKVFK